VTPANIGVVLSIVNVAHVELPALSVTINICVHVEDIRIQLVYADPSNVAHEMFVSENVMITQVL